MDINQIITPALLIIAFVLLIVLSIKVRDHKKKLNEEELRVFNFRQAVCGVIFCALAIACHQYLYYIKGIELTFSVAIVIVLLVISIRNVYQNRRKA